MGNNLKKANTTRHFPVSPNKKRRYALWLERLSLRGQKNDQVFI